MNTNKHPEHTINKDRLEILLSNSIDSYREVKRSLNKLTSIQIIFFCLAASIALGVISVGKIKTQGVLFAIDPGSAFSLFIFLGALFTFFRSLTLINLYMMKESVRKYYYLQFNYEADMFVFTSPTITNLTNSILRSGVIGFCVSITLIGIALWQIIGGTPYLGGYIDKQSDTDKHLIEISSFILILSLFIEISAGKIASSLAE